MHHADSRSYLANFANPRECLERASVESLWIRLVGHTSTISKSTVTPSQGATGCRAKQLRAYALLDLTGFESCTTSRDVS